MRAWAQTGLLLAVAALAIHPAELKLSATSAAAQHRPAAPKELLDRASAWVEGFVAAYQNWAAEETLEQQRLDKKGQVERRRIIRSDYLVLRLPPGRELAEYRDVVAVDDKELQSPDARRAKWPRLVAAATRDELAALVSDPAAHRFSPEFFGNLPLLVTRFAERYRDRITYFFLPEESGAEQTLIGYRQFDGSGLLEFDSREIFPQGRAWIDPNDGHIFRITEELAYKNTEYVTTVEFTYHDDHAAWLPAGMTVQIYDKSRMREQNIYTYSGWRRLASASRADTASPAPKPRK